MAQPELLAITQLTRRVSSGRILDGGAEVAAFRRKGSNYPVFAKPIDGKYSLSVIGADGYDAAADRVLNGGAEPVPQPRSPALAGRKAVCVLRRRLAAHLSLAAMSGPRL